MSFYLIVQFTFKIFRVRFPRRDNILVFYNIGIWNFSNSNFDYYIQKLNNITRSEKGSRNNMIPLGLRSSHQLAVFYITPLYFFFYFAYYSSIYEIL